MTLAPVWRTRLVGVGAGILAMWCGAAIASQELTWPVLLAAGLLGLVLTRVQPLTLGTLLIGAVTCGYIVGNRGFAQISLSDRFPLLPAEMVLLVAGGTLAIQCALRRELPLRRDFLNTAVLLWLAVGTARLPFDFRNYGLAAIRDFALVYYAAFFLLVQWEARDERARRFLQGCLAASCVALLVIYTLFVRFPDFFLTSLTLRGIPIIFYKGDLAGTFMAVGAVLHFFAFERDRRWSRLVLSLVLTAGAVGSNNRASVLALGVVAVLLALSGRWRFMVYQFSAAVAAAVVIQFVAFLGNKPWTETPLYGAYERTVSLLDPFGERSYSGEDTAYKGDNNRFRAAWWRAVFDETVEGNPAVGLGFGHDLAARFVRDYYADAVDDFSARSPHNVALTVFARMGVIGLIPFLMLVATMIRRTRRAARLGPSSETALWCAAWIILVSACFGVVLEGPMGAVVFWTLLGLASSARTAIAAGENESPDSSDLHLRETPARGELAPSRSAS